MLFFSSFIITVEVAEEQIDRFDRRGVFLADMSGAMSSRVLVSFRGQWMPPKEYWISAFENGHFLE